MVGSLVLRLQDGLPSLPFDPDKEYTLFKAEEWVCDVDFHDDPNCFETTVEALANKLETVMREAMPEGAKGIRWKLLPEIIVEKPEGLGVTRIEIRCEANWE